MLGAFAVPGRVAVTAARRWDGSAALRTRVAGLDSLGRSLTEPHRIPQNQRMAIVTSFEQGKRSLSRHKTDGPCEYHVVLDKEGNRYLQLSTFGSPTRQGSGSSQVLQFDEASAKKLVEILHDFAAHD